MIKVLHIKPEKDYRLFVKLSNGRSGYFDVSPYLDKGIFKELRDPNYFKLARLGFGGVTWPHRQDFSADTIDYELQVLQERVA